MVIRRFEDIIAWKKAQDLAVVLYEIFRDSRDTAFKNQILKAVISISNNIAEGFNRDSDADFRRFLIMAKGSANEVKSMLHLSERLGYIQSEQKAKLETEIDEIRKTLTGLIKSLTAPKA